MAQPIQFPMTVHKAADILSEIIIDNKRVSKPDDTKRDPFTSKNKVSIRVIEYIERLVKYTNLEESTLVMALIYIDRLCSYSNYIITDKNIHRVILVSIITAIKYNEDDIYTNSFYAKVGGVSKQELNLLEIEFSKMIRYRLFVKEELYYQYRAYLKQYKQEKFTN
jgi:hypothetical protein